MAEILHHIPCPICASTIALLGTSLKEIIQARRLPKTGEPFLLFVCQGCKAAFPYDYQQRVGAAAIPAEIETARYRRQSCFSVVAGCVHYDTDECDDSLVELIAVRPADADKHKLVEREMPTWDLSRLRCANSHPILHPDPTKAYEHSDMDLTL